MRSDDQRAGPADPRDEREPGARAIASLPPNPVPNFSRGAHDASRAEASALQEAREAEARFQETLVGTGAWLGRRALLLLTLTVAGALWFALIVAILLLIESRSDGAVTTVATLTLPGAGIVAYRVHRGVQVALASRRTERELSFIASLPFRVRGYRESLGLAAKLYLSPVTRHVRVRAALRAGSPGPEVLRGLAAHGTTVQFDEGSRVLSLSQVMECSVGWYGDPAEPRHEHNRAVRTWLRHVLGVVLPALHGATPVDEVSIDEVEA